MPLETKVKTVLFHDGPFDETDRFLLREPATDYIENLQFHRKGNLQKRRGNELVSTVPNPSGDPFFVQSIQNGLHVLTDTGARSFEDGEWSETDLGGFLGMQELLLETPPVGGMGHISMKPYFQGGSSIVCYVVVYEVRETSTSNSTLGAWVSTPKHVVVQNYSTDGRFLSQKRIENARSPKVLLHPNQVLFPNALTVIYQDIDDDKLYTRIYVPESNFLAPFGVATGLTVSPVFGMEAHASFVPYSALTEPSPADFTRLGAGADGHARYHVASDFEADRLLVLYQFEGNVTIARLNNNLVGVEDDTSIANATTPQRFEVFALEFSPGSQIHLMFGGFRGSTVGSTVQRRSQVIVRRYNSTTLAQEWSETVRDDTAAGTDFYPRTYTHGSLRKESLTSKVAWMIHDSGQAVGYDPELTAPTRPGFNLESVRDRNTGLHYGTLNDLSLGDPIGTPRFLPHHRLASECFWQENELYAAVQQWHDCTPYTDNMADNGDKPYVKVLGATVPRSTVLAVFDIGANSVRPVAVLDPGSSKTGEYAETEMQVHLPPAIPISGSVLVPNRIILRAEDLSMKWSESGVPPSDKRTVSLEHPADAMCRIYKITKGIGARKLTPSEFGDGVFVPSAIPMWFDGRFFGEAGPLDQPEIIDVRDSRMEETGFDGDDPNGNPPRCRINYEGIDAATVTKEWRKIQIIVGYFDAAGNKHRSAPSSVIFVHNVTNADVDRRDGLGSFPENWRGRRATIYFTLPLSLLPSSLEYFVEAYVSDGPDTDPVLIDTNTLDLSTTLTPDQCSIEIGLVRWNTPFGPGGNDFELPVRTARAIYTAGGELPSDPWPALNNSVVTSTRMFALDSNNAGKVLVSKRFQDFIAPEYNALLDINLGDERDLLCIDKMDDKTIIFEKDDIHVIYGDGPKNNGKGEDFAVHYISTDVGCEDQESIVECPAGLVFFRKERGFYLLDRKLNIKYIGEKVFDLSKGIDVVSAELVSASGEVRFLCVVTGDQGDPDGGHPGAGTERPPRPIRENKAPDSDFALVWDYEKDQWSVFANYPGAASTIHQGRYTRLLSDWSIWQERENTDRDYTDPTGDNRTLLRTGWLPISDNGQGYSRLHRMNILGRYLSTLGRLSIPRQHDACDIQVKIWYDYEEGFDVTPQTKLFKYQDFGFDPFSKRNIRAERLQFTITPPEGRGRCQAVKLEFEEVLPANLPNGDTHALGQGFEISSIDFEIGVDKRVTRHLAEAVLK